jgi:hypothetical protein
VADSAVAKANGLVARITEAVSRVSNFVELIGHGFEEALRRFYGQRAADRIIAEFGYRLWFLARVGAVGLCILLLHKAGVF